MKVNKSLIDILQNWYIENCDGDWEHEFGVTIDTLDNPGWTVKIDLSGTKFENLIFTSINTQLSVHDWMQCQVLNKQFIGAGGPNNLKDILRTFFNWVEMNRNR